jgi:hypothetical protein
MAEPFAFRDAQGNLRLDEALGERYVRHYTRILESSGEEFRAMQLQAIVQPPPPEDPGRHWDGWQEPRGPLVDGYELTRAGTGPEACSSSQALALLPEICWDVCGYYRRLGFSPGQFRVVTPRQLRLRYLELDPRQENERLFYALAQLLDPVIRRAYDRMPLGGLFLGDRDVRELIERQAAMEASRRNAADPQGAAADQGVVLKEWGFDKAASAAEARERLRGQQEPPGDPGSALGSTLSGWDRRWSYFRLADPWAPPEEPDVQVLETWQALLCGALSDRGITGRFAVGFWPGHAPKMWRDSNNCCIFFIGKEQPAQDTANEAIRGYLAQG